MDREQLEKIFRKHFKSIGKSLEEKIITNHSKPFDDFYHSPLVERDFVVGSIFNTSNIRYGDFLEEVINEFLKENGAIINKIEKKKGHFDLLFEFNNNLYIGEIKMRDNHDSTKKKGQVENLINKTKLQKTKNKEKML